MYLVWFICVDIGIVEVICLFLVDLVLFLCVCLVRFRIGV